MESSLIIATIVKKDGETFAKDLLLNSNKVKRFWAAISPSANHTEFIYDFRFDKREKPTRYTAAHTVAQFDALLREPPNEAVIPLYVTSEGGRFKTKTIVNHIIYLNIDSLIFGQDNADGVSATLYVDNGAFEIYVLNVSHTISQINERASQSLSFSETGL